MSTLRGLLARALGLLRRTRRERELADEFESHMQHQVDANLRAGLGADEARRAALVKLGGLESAKEAYRDQAGVPIVEHAAQDMRFALRQLARNPGFTLTAICVLGLGIGASAALFAFVDAALIQPLPYRDPARLVSVTESAGELSPRTPLSFADYLDWKRMTRTVESLELYTSTSHLMPGPSGTEPVPAARVTAGFFRALGVAPALGRDFLPGEDAPEGARVALLSHGTWLRRFGGDPGIVGRTVALSDVPHTVVGVLPASFHFGPTARAEFWTLVRGTSSCEQRRSCHNLDGVARLRSGVSVAAADADMRTIASALEQQYPDSNRGQGASVIPLTEAINGRIRPILLLLLGGASLLLVIATVNVASLLLVRAERRRPEISVRRALGADRGRLVRQFLAEGSVLVIGGTLLGVGLAAGAMRLLRSLIPATMAANMPFLRDLALNSHVLWFMAAVAAAAALLFGLAPVLRAQLGELRGGLAAGSRTQSGTVWRRFAANLVVVELAVAVVLLVGAGLLGKSLDRLLEVDIGFDARGLATVDVAVPITRYKTDPEIVAMARQLHGRLETLPGVAGVGFTTQLPITYNGNTMWIRFVGRPYNGEHNEVNQRMVSASYLKTLSARLIAGRYFKDDEDATKRGVVVINKSLANTYFPGEDPIGKQFGNTDLAKDTIQEIVGIVDDVREADLDSPTWPTVYYPYNQTPDSYFSVVVRTAQSPAAALPAMIAAIRGLDPNLGVYDERTMSDRIDDSPATYLRRSASFLIGGFAAVALLLSIVGLYGLVAYSVSQRFREIGLRMALGASRAGVYRLVLAEAVRLAALGVALGLAGALALAVPLRQLLFETSAFDAATLGAVAATVAVLAVVASYVPAHRAASVDPTVALHAE